MPDLLTTAQVAEIVGVTPRQISQLARKGELPFAHKSPGRTSTYIFDAAVVRLWLQHRKSRRTQPGRRRRRRDQLEVTAS